MEEIKATMLAAVSSSVKAVGRFDPFMQTFYVATHEGAPLRSTRTQAEADARQWIVANYGVTQELEGESVQEEAGLVEEYSTEDLDEFITYHHETIRGIGEAKGRGQGFTEADDVEQAIMEHVITKWNLYAGQPASRVRKFFEKAANQFLRKERDDYMHFTCSYVYTPADVRRHLRESAWVEGDECPDVDAKVDLQAAFKELTPAKRRSVHKVFAQGVPISELSSAEERSVYRGVDDMTLWLNRKEGVRSYSLDELRGKLFSQL